jgi:hypothetical protein
MAAIKKRQAKLTVDATKFVESHGRMPRGYRNWCFCPIIGYDNLKEYYETRRIYLATYTEAKRLAAKDFGLVPVYVCP